MKSRLIGHSLCVLALTTPTLALAAEPATRPSSWQADPKAVVDAERARKTTMYREERVPAYALPDVLTSADGSKAASREQWEQKRRPEILNLFASEVYGRAPAAPAKVSFDIVSSTPDAMDGKATHKRVKITATGSDGKAFAFEASVMIPNQAAGSNKPPTSVPAFLLINNRGTASADPSRKAKAEFWPAEEIVARGYAAVVFNNSDVDPDDKADAARIKGVRGVWPDGGGAVGADAWGTIAAWAWGASRVMDYLESDPAINAKQVAVIGHSRGGKTALWAGAQDQRFALTISNDSGEVGAALARRRFGETTAVINKSFPHWFCANFKRYNDREDALPIDQHQLIALMAGRAVCVGSADRDLWADPRGEFLAVAAASPAFALYGEPEIKPDEMPPLDTPLDRGNRGYHVRSGTHNLTKYDWNRYMGFADKLWRK